MEITPTTPTPSTERSRAEVSPGAESSLGSHFGNILESIDRKLSSFDARLHLVEILHKEFQALREFSQQQVVTLTAENEVLKGSVKSLTEGMTRLSEETKRIKETILDLQARSTKDNLISSAVPDQEEEKPEVKYRPNQQPVNCVPTETAVTVPPAVPSNTNGSMPVISEVQYQHPVGVLNSVLVCDLVPAAAAAPPPPLNNSSSKKRRRPVQQDADQLYIKKPPNAFMLFLKEQRPKVVAEFNVTESAAVNAIVGQRWKSLSQDQQAKYYDQADKERLLHAQQHPDWSTKDNYGRQRKRIRRCTLAAASKPDEVTPQILFFTGQSQHTTSPHAEPFTVHQLHQVGSTRVVDSPASTSLDSTSEDTFWEDNDNKETVKKELALLGAPHHAAGPQ